MPDYISLGEAARILSERGTPGVTYWQLWRRNNEGRIPAQRVAGRIVIKRDDLPQVAETFAAPVQP
jgi:hypothetical protein